MRMDSGDEYLAALQDFAKAEEKQLTPELVDILEVVAKTGKCLYDWKVLKPFLVYTLDEVTKDFLGSSDCQNGDSELESMRMSLVESFNAFASAPFTLQRLAELLANPKRHYKTPAKYFRGLQKNILVVSTIDVEPASVKSLKRTRDQIAGHKQNGNVNLCSPTKVRRTTFQERLPTVPKSSDAMAIDENIENPQICLPSTETMESTSGETSKHSTENSDPVDSPIDDIGSSNTDSETAAPEQRSIDRPSQPDVMSSTSNVVVQAEGECSEEAAMEEG